MNEYIRAGFLYGDDEVDQAFGQVSACFENSDEFDLHRLGSDRLVLLTEQGRMDVEIRGRHKQYYIECDAPQIVAGVSCEFLAHEGGRQLLKRYLSAVRQIYVTTDPEYVYGMHSMVMEAIGIERPSPVTDDGLANDRIDLPTWLMIFPPAMVNEYGREWLLNLPAERIDELDDGGIMIVAAEAITEAESDTESAGIVLDAVEPLEAAFRDRE